MKIIGSAGVLSRALVTLSGVLRTEVGVAHLPAPQL